jgi:replicative DNA helicase
MEELELKYMFCKPEDERALLAFSFKSIDNFYTLLAKMSAKDFLNNEHATLFVLLNSLLKKGVEHFDVSMVVDLARNDGCLHGVGGVDYIVSINGMPVSDSNFNIYLNNVLEASTKYKLYSVLRESTANLVENAKEGISSSDLMGYVENKILNLSTDSRAIAEPTDLADGLLEYIDERRDNPIKMSGISTGYAILNNQIDGLIPGTLHIVAARLKEGKSAFLTNISLYVSCMLGLPVLYIDTEMSFGQWRNRAIAALADVKEREVIHGGYSKETYDQIIEKCVKIVDQGRLFHEYMPGYSVDKIVALYKKYKIKHNLGMIVFDYLKEPSSGSIDRNRKEYQVLGDVTTILKDLSGQLNVPALTAVQLGRSMDIADSDRIARYGDVIMHWKGKEASEIETDGWAAGSHKLIIKDTRRGGQTSEQGIGYQFIKDRLRIKEVDVKDQAFTRYDEVINEGSAHYDDDQRL